MIPILSQILLFVAPSVKTGGKTTFVFLYRTIVDVALSMTSPWAEVDAIKITFKQTALVIYAFLDNIIVFTIYMCLSLYIVHRRNMMTGNLSS